METNSEELLHRGVETAEITWKKFSSHVGWAAADVDRFFCHQVGSAHTKLLFNKLELDNEKNFETLATLGNVGSVSAPITMALAIEKGAVSVFEPAGNEETRLAADHVVLGLGGRSDEKAGECNFLSPGKIIRIGDCYAPGNALSAIHAAFDAAVQI